MKSRSRPSCAGRGRGRWGEAERELGEGGNPSGARQRGQCARKPSDGRERYRLACEGAQAGSRALTRAAHAAKRAAMRVKLKTTKLLTKR